MTTPRKPGAKRPRGNAVPSPESMARQQRCMDLAVQGLTYTQIAAAEGYKTPSGARHAVMAGFRRAAVESVEILLPKYEARGELMWRHGVAMMAAGLKEGDLDKFKAGSTVADRALARLMRLHGMDGSQMAVQVSAPGADLESLKQQFMAMLDNPQTMPIDAEVVHSEENPDA